MSTHPQASHSLSMRYGLLALPLAFVALPMYVNLPHFYATQFAVPLASLGAVLLFTVTLGALWFLAVLLRRGGDSASKIAATFTGS